MDFKCINGMVVALLPAKLVVRALSFLCQIAVAQHIEPRISLSVRGHVKCELFWTEASASQIFNKCRWVHYVILGKGLKPTTAV